MVENDDRVLNEEIAFRRIRLSFCVFYLACFHIISINKMEWFEIVRILYILEIWIRALLKFFVLSNHGYRTISFYTSSLSSGFRYWNIIM